MNRFANMWEKTTSSPYYDEMLRFARPLKDYLKINHFWYYKITPSGLYSYAGTHAKWSEFCFEESMTQTFTCLRHPSTMKKGVILMKANPTEEFNKIIKTAWEKYQINFSLNLSFPTPDGGVQAIGFGTNLNDPLVEQNLINELPLLRYFATTFQEKNKKLLDLLENNCVDLALEWGSSFYDPSKDLKRDFKRKIFLEKLGFGAAFLLTPRELDVLRYFVNGYPSSYIAEQLKLSNKTVENYIALIKDKLSCSSKIELIHKAKAFAATGFFEI